MSKTDQVICQTEDFVTYREITVLTTGAFSRKIIIISTTFSNIENKGETAIKQQAVLNCFACNFNDGFTIVKKHTGLQKALEFHRELIQKQHFGSCEVEE